MRLQFLPSLPSDSEAAANSIRAASFQFIDALESAADGAVDDRARPFDAPLVQPAGSDAQPVTELLFHGTPISGYRFEHLLPRADDQFGGR